jgi:hypothetical protein
MSTMPATNGSLGDASALELKNLRARTLPLAQELGRLGSAAIFVSNLRSSLDEQSSELSALIESSRGLMHCLQSALQASLVEEAKTLLEKLADDCCRLRGLVLESEEPVTVHQMETYLKQVETVSSDLLRRMVDFYARSCPRDSERRKKMAALATALARREELDARTPGQIQQQFRRLGLLRDLDFLEPDEASLECIDRLREEVLSPDGDSAARLPLLAAEAQSLIDGLMDSVYTLKGLSKTVSLLLALDEKALLAERRQVFSFDALVEGLENALDAIQQEQVISIDEEKEETSGSDRAALELLEQIDREIREASEAGGLPDETLHLDKIEVQAFKIELEDRKKADLLARAAVCRVAIDRLARKHAKSQQPPGVTPAPVPKGTAVTLVREAKRLERDLQDLMMHEIVQGATQSSKTISRCYHRLSRSRLGLTILAELQTDEISSEGKDGAAAEGSIPEEGKVRKDLRVACLYRSALKDGKKMKAASKKRSRNSRKFTARQVLVAVLAVTVVATGIFHLLWWRQGASEEPPPHARLDPPAPLTEVLPVKDAVIARADISWETGGAQELETRVQSLWAEAEKQGYKRLMLMNSTGDKPLAVASPQGVAILADLPDKPHL